MRSIVKKMVIYSMVGLMQVGFGASIIEASPRHNDQQHERRQEDRPEHRDERINKERARHEKEMQRRDHENEHEWRERQEREKKHHEETMRAIGGLALLYILTNN